MTVVDVLTPLGVGQFSVNRGDVLSSYCRVLYLCSIVRLLAIVYEVRMESSAKKHASLCVSLHQ